MSANVVGIRVLDLKPGNVIVEETKRIPVRELGLCRTPGNVHVLTDTGKTLCYYGESHISIAGRP